MGMPMPDGSQNLKTIAAGEGRLKGDQIPAPFGGGAQGFFAGLSLAEENIAKLIGKRRPQTPSYNSLVIHDQYRYQAGQPFPTLRISSSELAFQGGDRGRALLRLR